MESAVPRVYPLVNAANLTIPCALQTDVAPSVIQLNAETNVVKLLEHAAMGRSVVKQGNFAAQEIAVRQERFAVRVTVATEARHAAVGVIVAVPATAVELAAAVMAKRVAVVANVAMDNVVGQTAVEMDKVAVEEKNVAVTNKFVAEEAVAAIR